MNGFVNSLFYLIDLLIPCFTSDRNLKIDENKIII